MYLYPLYRWDGVRICCALLKNVRNSRNVAQVTCSWSGSSSSSCLVAVYTAHKQTQTNTRTHAHRYQILLSWKQVRVRVKGSWAAASIDGVSARTPSLLVSCCWSNSNNHICKPASRSKPESEPLPLPSPLPLSRDSGRSECWSFVGCQALGCLSGLLPLPPDPKFVYKHFTYISERVSGRPHKCPCCKLLLLESLFFISTYFVVFSLSFGEQCQRT